MILLTGGAGYIGSHTLLALLRESKNVIVLDDLSSGSLANFNAACRLAGNRGSAKFIQGSVTDKSLLSEIFKNHDIDTVYHFAAKKSLSESIAYPAIYQEVNINGTSTLLQIMHEHDVKKLLFSSSSAVYDSNNAMPFTERSRVQPTSPYGHTKLITELELRSKAANGLRVAVLRYSNPVGAVYSSLQDRSSDNLFPAISRVISGEQKALSLFGTTYDTFDGSAMRDYIHINDVVAANLAAVDYINKNHGFYVWNIGSGKAKSVLQIISIFNSLLRKPINIDFKIKRKGDVAQTCLDVSQAYQQLGWQPKYSIDDAIASVIN